MREEDAMAQARRPGAPHRDLVAAVVGANRIQDRLAQVIDHLADVVARMNNRGGAGTESDKRPISAAPETGVIALLDDRHGKIMDEIDRLSVYVDRLAEDVGDMDDLQPF